MSTKTYSSKANANRAAKTAGHLNFEAVKVGDRWAFRVKAVNTLQANRGSSTVDGPVARVWEIAENNRNARRKDVVQMAVNAGVAYYTARTQYQAWYTATKGGTAPVQQKTSPVQAEATA